MLNGVLKSWMIKKSSNPVNSEIMREGAFHLNLLGGMGMYHRNAQIRRNRNRFTFLTKTQSANEIFKPIENAPLSVGSFLYVLNPYMLS